ncbi:putative reverse transcriptase domain-containing protein [Tanacetum coccineum]
MPLSTYLNLGLAELAHTKLTVELADRTMKYPKGIAENMLVGIGKFVFPVDFIILDMPEDIKVPLILGRPFLSTAHAMIDVFKRKITLRVEEEIIFSKVLNLLKESYGPQFSEAYYEASHINNSIPRKEKDPGRASVSVMPLSTYLNLGLGELAHTKLTVELVDRTVKYPKGIAENVLVVLERDQVDDLMPTIEECEVFKKFRARNDARIASKVFGYPSDCDHDKKIRMDYAYNLKFSCMIVLEDMDAYRDEGIGDVIFCELFLREFRINARRFDGMITFYNDLTESKEIDNVGGESTIWKSGSVGVLKLQDGCSTQILGHKLNMENLPSKISRDFLILILLNSRI